MTYSEPVTNCLDSARRFATAYDCAELVPSTPHAIRLSTKEAEFAEYLAQMGAVPSRFFGEDPSRILVEAALHKALAHAKKDPVAERLVLREMTSRNVPRNVKLVEILGSNDMPGWLNIWN